MVNIVPFDRNMKGRGDQHVFQLNTLRSKLLSEEVSKAVFSPDGSQAIVMGMQPDGTWGVKGYSVQGDTVTLIKDYGV